MTVILPGGRGPWISEDALVGNSESIDARRRLIDLPELLYWATYPPHASMAGFTFAAGSNRYMLLDRVDRKGVFKRAQVRVTTLNAGAFLRVALYRYVGGKPTHNIELIPGSEALFDGSSTGIKTVPVNCTIEPGTYIVINVGSNDTTAAYIGRGTNSAADMHAGASLALPSFTATLPATVKLTAANKSGGQAIPHVIYMTDQATDLL